MERQIIDWQKMNSIVTVPKAQTDYLFFDQLRQVRDRCSEIIKGNEDRLQQESILGIVGDRGSGKSSFLHTVKENLSDEYCVLDIVDPSIFNNSMSIIELFVSQIYKRLTENDNNEFSYTNYACDNLHMQLKEITKVLSDYRAGVKEFYENYTYGEVLSNVRQRVNLSVLIKKLVYDFLEFYRNSGTKYKGIVLCIDDVDLVSNQQIFGLLEEVRKYLAGNIIVITAFHFKQLIDAILHVKIKENDELLVRSALTLSDVREQVARYVEKLIPVQNRIELLKISNLLNQSYHTLMVGLVADDHMDISRREMLDSYLYSQGLTMHTQNIPTMSEWLYNALNARLRLKLCPIDKSEETILNLPQNLRGLLQLVRLIVDGMECLDLDLAAYTNKKMQEIIAKKIISNLQVYENYLRRNYQEILSSELVYIIESWKATDYRVKNHFICVELTKRIENIDSEMLSTLPVYQQLQAHNITIGDVFNVLETYKGCAPAAQQTQYFVYLLKVLYSIELLKSYLSACHKLDESLEIYLTLINAKLLHEDFIYFQTSSDKAKSLRFDKKLVEQDTDLKDICHRLLYSAVAVNSDLRRSSPNYSSDTDRKLLRESSSKARQYDTLKYQRLYDYDIQDFDSFIDGYTYLIDPLAFAGQKWYAQKTFSHNMYVFYSMFDLDAFVRFDYGRAENNKSDAELLARLITKIDNILIGAIEGKSRKDMLEHKLVISMSSPIFCDEKLKNTRKMVFFGELNREYSSKLYDQSESDSVFKRANLWDKDVMFTDEVTEYSNTVVQMPKYEIVSLIGDILSSNLPLQINEIYVLKSISERLSVKGTMARKNEKRFVQQIVAKYSYLPSKK